MIAWDELSAAFSRIVARNLATRNIAATRHHDITQAFALGRLREGQQAAAFLRDRGFEGRVLDVGAGNGGASIALANYGRFDVTAVDIVPNTDVLALRRAFPALPVAQLVCDGESLPFADESFDVVLCLDTIEHVADARRMAREIMRVLRRGGICMLTTPPRLRYAFRRDPHYGIPLLLLLPDSLQRRVGTAILGDRGTYDVAHIFSRADEIAELFPGVRMEVLWDRAFTDADRGLRERLRWRARYSLWDRILLTKE